LTRHPVQEGLDLRLDFGPARWLVVDHDLAVHPVTDRHRLLSEATGVAVTAAHPIHQDALDAAQVSGPHRVVPLALEIFDRPEGSQHVEELLLGVPELAVRRLVGQGKGLLAGEAAALDLNAGQSIFDGHLVARSRRPVGLEAHGLQEAAGALDGQQLALEEGTQGEVG